MRKKNEEQPSSVSTPSSPTSSSSSNTSPKSVSAPSSPNARLLNQGNKGKRWLKDHPKSQIIDGKTMRRITRSQTQEMQNLVARLESMHIYGDEDNGEPKGEMVNYALCSISNSVSNIAVVEPSCYEEACSNGVWMQAMKEEIDAIERNNTWELCKLPKGKKLVGSKWVYKTKCKSDGSVERYKARLVAKGFTQQYGVDFEETFALVAR